MLGPLGALELFARRRRRRADGRRPAGHGRLIARAGGPAPLLRRHRRRTTTRDCTCSTRRTPPAILAIAGEIDLGTRSSSSPPSPAARSRRCRCSSTSSRWSRRTATASWRSPTPVRAGRARRQHGFRRTFENDPNIGGRYSALSAFGLVPAALIGGPGDPRLLERRRAPRRPGSTKAPIRTSCRRGCGWDAILSELAQPAATSSRSSSARPVSGFGLWVEQLVAESTGKQGTGILPVADEPLLSPPPTATTACSSTCATRPRADARARRAGRGARAAPAIPRSRSPPRRPEDLGRVFFLAEFAGGRRLGA